MRYAIIRTEAKVSYLRTYTRRGTFVVERQTLPTNYIVCKDINLIYAHEIHVTMTRAQTSCGNSPYAITRHGCIAAKTARMRAVVAVLTRVEVNNRSD